MSRPLVPNPPGGPTAHRAASAAAPCRRPVEEVWIPLSRSLPCHRLRLQLIDEVLLADRTCLHAERLPGSVVDRVGHEVSNNRNHRITVGHAIRVGLIQVLDVALCWIRLTEVQRGVAEPIAKFPADALEPRSHAHRERA